MGEYFADDPAPPAAAPAAAPAPAPAPGSASRFSPNKDLTGEKLVFLTPFAIPVEWIAGARRAYPGLEVEARRFNPWAPGNGSPPDDVDWARVTILVTGPSLPTPQAAPRLRLVQLQSAGANYALDKPLFKEKGVVFCTANGVHGPQIAEWVIATYLTFQHRLLHYYEKQKEGYWDRDTHDLDTVDAVSQRVGILGYGSLGRQVARAATALGSEVYAYTARPRPTPESRRDDAYYVPGLGDPEGVLPAKWFSGTGRADIHAFLASGLDLLVVALPLTDATRGLLGADEFKVLYDAAPEQQRADDLTEEERARWEAKGRKKRPRTYVSNVGRGPVIRTDDLLAALDGGWIRGAALDVTDPEPLPKDHPLWTAENVTVTPHISGNSTHYTDRLLAIVDVNLERLSRGEDKFINEVNKKRGY
ncbi:hypothetical protein SLS62_008481 [Diatrype stigma]|uniref:D-isomer specific 2-hydroxyacid dehydrogenase NAD-binding domain-containing protein n=1 Tax=Diatrype stigma TaxID=117547 RepID=A0AAN9ULA8_9PEZI